MRRIRFLGAAVGALVLVSCGPSLTATMIKNHPKLDLEAMQPRVVESSAPMAPPWTLRLEHGAVGYIPFSGQAYAPTLEDARAEAERDLLVSVASFVAVDVEAELETIEREQTKAGVTSSSMEATQRTKTNTAAALSGVRSDEVFWEKVLVSPLVPDRFMYRAYVHARVDRSVIIKARLGRQLARQKATNRKMLVVLPFRAVVATPEAAMLQRAFVEELSRRLGASDGLYVGDPEMVDGLLGATTSEAAALQTVREALSPEWVVGGSYQVHREQVRVTFTIYAGDDVQQTGTSSRPLDELFLLEDDLTAQIAAAVKVAQKQTKRAAPPPLEAAAAYYAAYDLYRAGKNDAAIEALTRAVLRAPDEPLFLLRLGRVLERLGRYGRARIRPVGAIRLMPNRRRQGGAQQEGVETNICVPWHLISADDPTTFFRAASGAPASTTVVLEGTFIDDVASAVTYVLDGGPTPELVGPAVPNDAAGAYWRAFVAATRRADRDVEFDVRLAIADLLVRNDRPMIARAMYERLLRDLPRDRLSMRSLVLFGRGRAERQQGELVRAKSSLLEARQMRRALMERPYLLEIENELGQLEVELGHYVAARAHYAEALRIAEELDDAYFRAVLGNNLGVLELLLGRADRADAHFRRAWRVLSDLDEAEGRIATNLNIAYVGAGRGDLDAARTYLKTVKAIVARTGQSGRRAELLAHEAHLARLGGDELEALRRLLSSQFLFEQSGRSVAALRARSNVVAAEFDVLLENRGSSAQLWCLIRKANQLTGELSGARAGTIDHAYAALADALIGSIR